MITERTEDRLGREIMRLMQIGRGPAEKILDEALSGREKTADSVSRLMRFIIVNFGQDGSETTNKYWKVCSAFLDEAGVQPKDSQKIRRPFLVFGENGFKSVLEEFEQ